MFGKRATKKIIQIQFRATFVVLMNIKIRAPSLYTPFQAHSFQLSWVFILFFLQFYFNFFFFYFSTRWRFFFSLILVYFNTIYEIHTHTSNDIIFLFLFDFFSLRLLLLALFYFSNQIATRDKRKAEQRNIIQKRGKIPLHLRFWLVQNSICCFFPRLFSFLRYPVERFFAIQTHHIRIHQNKHRKKIVFDWLRFISSLQFHVCLSNLFSLISKWNVLSSLSIHLRRWCWWWLWCVLGFGRLSRNFFSACLLALRWRRCR